MIRLHVLAAAAMCLAHPAVAQNPAQLRAELRAKETAARQDADKLVEIAKWAQDQGLGAEARRILQSVLKTKPDHEAANLALGNVRYEGKWVSPQDAEALRKKAIEAEFKASGLVEESGVWIEKDHVADAKKGIYHHEGEKLTRGEKLAVQAGKVRHPRTGQFIDAADLEKAQTMFPIGTEGRWVGGQEADAYHRERSRPWAMRTRYCVLVSTLPLKDLDGIRPEVDKAYEIVRPLLVSVDPSPVHRPVVVVAGTEDEYRTLGSDMGGAGSAYGAFLGEDDRPVSLPLQGDVVPGVCHWHKDWGPYYARHAAGLAYVNGVRLDAGAALPHWFVQAFGSYASRFADRFVAGHFGEQHVQKGGVKDLKDWFASFAISGDMESKAIDANVYQAGLMLSFATGGGDKKVTDAMLEISNALASGQAKGVDKSVDKLQDLLIEREDAIKSWLQKLIREKGR